jgi:hypothetical protein
MGRDALDVAAEAFRRGKVKPFNPKAPATSFEALREALQASELRCAALQASLARQLAIASAERRARELAERSRMEALRACVRARLP